MNPSSPVAAAALAGGAARDGPGDAVHQVGEEARVGPHLLAMPERRVEHAPLVQGVGPGQAEVAVGALDALLRHVGARGVEAQQHLDLAAVPVAELVDLVGQLEARAQVRGRGVLRVLDLDRHLLVPGMPVEVPADQLAVRRVFVERVGGAVDPGEAASRLDEVDQGFLVDLQLTGGVEDDALVALQLLARDLAEVLGGHHLEAPLRRSLELLLGPRQRPVRRAQHDGVLPPGGVRQEEHLRHLRRRSRPRHPRHRHRDQHRSHEASKVGSPERRGRRDAEDDWFSRSRSLRSAFSAVMPLSVDRNGGRGSLHRIQPSAGENHEEEAQRRHDRLPVHGPRAQQRLAAGEPLLRPAVRAGDEGRLRPQRGRGQEGGRPPGLAGARHRLGGGRRPQGHRHRGHLHARRQPHAASPSPPPRPEKTVFCEKPLANTLPEAAEDARRRQEERRRPHDLPQLPARPRRARSPGR